MKCEDCILAVEELRGKSLVAVCSANNINGSDECEFNQCLVQDVDRGIVKLRIVDGDGDTIGFLYEGDKVISKGVIQWIQCLNTD